MINKCTVEEFKKYSMDVDDSTKYGTTLLMFLALMVSTYIVLVIVIISDSHSITWYISECICTL